MRKRITVMISSTARDLPQHRAQVLDACLRQSMFPVMMEHLPASDADAIARMLGIQSLSIVVGILWILIAVAAFGFFVWIAGRGGNEKGLK